MTQFLDEEHIAALEKIKMPDKEGEKSTEQSPKQTLERVSVVMKSSHKDIIRESAYKHTIGDHSNSSIVQKGEFTFDREVLQSSSILMKQNEFGATEFKLNPLSDQEMI